MRRRLLLITVLLGACWLKATAGSYYATSEGLKEIESASVYSIYQDGRGALWLNTSNGLYRFDGNRLESTVW